MLGKLMKYDLRSGIRTFSLIWIGLAALAAINGLTLRIAFDGDHPVETFRKMGRIDAQTAGQIDAERTSVPFFGGDRLAAGLLERQRRQNTAGPVIGREFGPGTL